MGGKSFGGGDRKQTTNTTNVTTKTTTTMRDVGLTGAHAVDMAAVLDQGATTRQEIALDTVNTISQQSGKSFQTLVGGAGQLVESIANKSLEQTGETRQGILSLLDSFTSTTQAQTGDTQRRAQNLFLKAGESQQEAVSLIKTLLPVLLIPAVIALVPIFTRGRK